MSDAKENEEAAQGTPSVVEEKNQQLVDAKVQIQPVAASAPVPVEETSNHVENLKEEPPAENKNVEPEAVLEGIPKEDVQNTLHSVSVEADAQISSRNECEEASVAKVEAEEFPQGNKEVKNDDNVHQNSIGDAETAVEVNPEACGVADSKTCNNSDPMPTSHNEPVTPQPAHADTNAEIMNVLEVDNKADEKQATEPADNGISNSKHMFFLDVDHSYDGNESGTEEEQSAFMKELENFFRERSMEFKPPKFYGEGLNCLK